MVIPKMKY